MATSRISTASEMPNFKKPKANKFIIQNFCKNNHFFDVQGYSNLREIILSGG
jgi:hypothetical protein